MTAETVLRELDGLRALARSLVHGDAEADDLLQEAAVAAIEHPPGDDRPVRPWLAVVLRNRRRMDVRASARRRARETAAVAELDRVSDAPPEHAIDRARALEKLSAALVALDEPFRTTVVARYLDGKTAAEIACEQGVPSGTVRWRLKSGLERLRAALDDRERQWRRAFVPLAGVTLVKTKTPIIALAILLLLLGAGALMFALRDRDAAPDTPSTAAGGPARDAAAGTPSQSAPAGAAAVATPGQGRATTIELGAVTDAAVSGRVVNWSTGDGVEGAELAFLGDAGITTVRSRANGAFELVVAAPGRYALSSISAPRFLPYAPELQHSSVHVDLVAGRAVRGVELFLFPAIDYRGRVVDSAGAPVAGARVRLLGTPAGEQAIESLETQWTTGTDGTFAFHAADDALLEAARGNTRGWGRVDEGVMLTRRLEIKLGATPPLHVTIAGRVVDEDGKPIAEALVRAYPQPGGGPKHEELRPSGFALSGPDGAFTIANLDHLPYHVTAELDGYVDGAPTSVTGGRKDVVLELARGELLAGRVVDREGNPVPAFTLLVMRRLGTARALIHARSIVHPLGSFEVRVEAGDYEVSASATGWAPSEPVATTAPARDMRVTVTAGATLRGEVIAADGKGPISYARIMREAYGGGASARPANAGTVTRSDGSFELTGLPPGPIAIRIGAGGYHPKIEAGLTAYDGASLGPLTITLQPIAEGEQPSLELIGIGVALSADGDTLKVDRVLPDSGAAAAGIVAGDRVIAVDGIGVTKLGLEGAVAKIRGVANTTVSVTLRRDDKSVQLVVTRKKIRT